MIEMIDLHTMAAAIPFLKVFKISILADEKHKKNIFKNNVLYIRVNVADQGEAKPTYRYWAIKSPAELALIQRTVLNVNPAAPILAPAQEEKKRFARPAGGRDYHALDDGLEAGNGAAPVNGEGRGEAKLAPAQPQQAAAAPLPPAARRITLFYLDNCPQATFNPMAKAHRGCEVDLVGLWDDLQDKEKAVVAAIQKRDDEYEPAYTTLAEAILALSRVETIKKKKFEKTTKEQLVNRLLLSTHFLDSFFWQMAGNSGDIKSMGYFVKTGAADGGFIFVLQLIQELIQDYSQYKLGIMSLGEYLRGAFGEAGLFGLATTLSNTAWQPIVNQAIPAGDDQQPDQQIYATTMLGCGLIFLTSLLITQGLYRLSGICQQEKTLAQRWSLFKRSDLPKFMELAFSVAVSAGTFCFTLFDKVLGIPNIFHTASSPSSTGAKLLNGVKAAGTGYLAYWLAEFMKAVGRSIKKCWNPSVKLDLEKIIAEISAEMYQELNDLVITQRPVFYDFEGGGSLQRREESRLISFNGSRIVPVDRSFGH